MASLFDSLTQEDIDALLKRITEELDSEGEGLDVADKKSDEEDTSVKKTDAKKTEEKSADSDTASDSEGSTTEGDSEAKTDSQAEVADKTEKKAETVTESEAKDGAKIESESKSESKAATEGQTETKTDAVTIAEDGGIFGGGLTKKATDQATEQESTAPEVKSVFDATAKVDLGAQAQKAAEEQAPVTTKVAVEEAPTTTLIQEALSAAKQNANDTAVQADAKAQQDAEAAAAVKAQIEAEAAAAAKAEADAKTAASKAQADAEAAAAAKAEADAQAAAKASQAVAVETANAPVATIGQVDERQQAQASAAATTPQTVSDIFATPTLTPVVKAVKEADGTTTTSVDSTGNAIQLPTFIERGTPLAPTDIFTPGQLGNAPELGGIRTGISPGTGVGGAGGGPVSNVQLGDQTITISFDDIVQKEIQRELDAMRSEGVFSSDPEFGTRVEVAANRGLDIYNQDVARAKELGRYIDLGPQKGATTPGQGGPPIILPIAGLDPTTAAAVTALGLIFSGGKIARVNPQNPVGSVVGAVQGIGQTGQNVIDVATGQTSLGEIWDPGSTGAPSGGGGGGGAAAGTGQQTTGTGVIGAIGGIFGGGTSGAGASTGGQQTTGTGTVGVTPGALGGDTTQAPSTTQQPIRQTGTAQEPEMATSTSVPGLFGGGQTIQPAVPQQPQAAPIRQTGTAQGPDIATSSSVPGLFGGGQTIEPATPRQAPLTPIRQTGTATGPNIVSQTPSVDLEPDVTSGPPGVTPTPSSVTPSTATPSTSTTASTPIVINAPTVGYTLPQAGTPAARNLYTEAGTTLSSLASPMQQFQIGVDATGKPIYGTIPQTGGRPSTLSEAIAQGYGGLAGGMREADVQNLFGAIGAATGRTPTAQGGYQAELNRAAAEQTAAANAALRLGNIMDAELLAGRAQALRQQANPELFGASGALPQYTQQAREQAMRDVAALRAAEAGQLTPEQIRNAQQAAREAYGARGQVFSQGAAAQEVLNRQQMIQQQQQIARQNLAQSMGQLGQGVAYQTANIFDPMGATLGGQYGMQSQNVGMNQALYNQAMGLTSGAGGYGFAQQMINPFTGYAQDVYGTNVNALNAAQIAAANRQAALEAAKMGQTGTYAQALGGLIASGGLGQIQSGISGGIQGLLNLLGGQWPTGSSSMITPTVARPGT